MARLAIGVAFLLFGCAARRPVKPRPIPARAKAVVRTARSYLPEENEGRRRAPKDCSDFVDRVFAENGVRLPRTAARMARLGRQVRSTTELRMGDLVFFSGENVGRGVGLLFGFLAAMFLGPIGAIAVGLAGAALGYKGGQMLGRKLLGS